MLAHRWAVAAAIPALLLLLAVSYLSVQFAMSERLQQSWVVHTYDVIDRVQRILSDVQDTETGQRGFLLTHQSGFLTPYHQGIARAKVDVAAFRALTADNASQQALAAALAALVDARFKILEDSLNAGQAVPATPALLASMVRGKERMDALRAALAVAKSRETRLLAQRIAAQRRAERYEVLAVAATALLALLVLGGIAFLLVRNNIRLEESERKLANESAILQATLDTIRDGIAMFASDGELCTFNAQFFSLLDFPPALARHGTRLEQFQEIDRARERPVLGGTSRAIEEGMRRVSLNGRELEIYRAAVPTGGFIVVSADVTARVRAEDVARQAQKMEAIGHLTGGVAHDFNNLLQVIGTNLELSTRPGDDDSRNAERTRVAIGAVARGAQLTAQLLAFARRQALSPRAFNAGRLVQDMTDLLRRTLGEHIAVECVLMGGLWATYVDPNQLENAILNLAINSRDAMAEGGKLTIEVANTFLDDAYALQHTEVTPGQYVMVAITDTGLGMSPETMARAFEPFFTTKAEGRGTGLGLSQVYGFVKQSGGHIKVYSELGQGTTIKLYLPRSRRAQDSVDPHFAGAVEGGSDRILVVEDDADVREAAADMLADLGYAVLKAENAEQALALLGGGATADLLFTDVVMPGPIGTREMVRRALELCPGMAVLYTSGYTHNAIVHNGQLDDDVFLLSKPYRREELARKIRSPLDARPAGPAAEPVARPLKVLVVEDVALIRMTTVEMLQEIGMVPLEAADGAEALSILEGDPGIEVLLTDLGLPGMSGRELVEEALKRRPALRVVVASGLSSGGEAGVLAQAIRLTKPFDLEQLRRAIMA